MYPLNGMFSNMNAGAQGPQDDFWTRMMTGQGSVPQRRMGLLPDPGASFGGQTTMPFNGVGGITDALRNRPLQKPTTNTPLPDWLTRGTTSPVRDDQRFPIPPSFGYDPNRQMPPMTPPQPMPGYGGPQPMPRPMPAVPPQQQGGGFSSAFADMIRQQNASGQAGGLPSLSARGPGMPNRAAHLARSQMLAQILGR